MVLPVQMSIHYTPHPHPNGKRLHGLHVVWFNLYGLRVLITNEVYFERKKYDDVIVICVIDTADLILTTKMLRVWYIRGVFRYSACSMAMLTISREGIWERFLFILPQTSFYLALWCYIFPDILGTIISARKAALELVPYEPIAVFRS